jgi:hypothetical protein
MITEAPDHRAQRHHRQAGDVGQRDDGNADRAERHGRRVGEQADTGRVEGIEAEAGQHRARDRDWCAEAGGPLDERAEREGDEKRLQAPVVGQAADRVLDDLEFPGVHRQAIQHDRRKDDPRDREETVGGAVDRRDERELERHPVDHERDDQRRAERRERRHPCRLSQEAEHEEQHGDRDGGDESRHTKTASDGFIVVLPHGCGAVYFRMPRQRTN